MDTGKKIKLKGPARQNEFDKTARPMKFHNTLDPKQRDVGSKTKLRPEKVIIKDTNSEKVYGYRTLIQKTIENIITEELDELPGLVVHEIRKNIRKGAKDLEQNWKNALHLLNKAYEVAGVKVPTPENKKAWKQYEELIQYSVKELADARGLDGPWRITYTITEASTHKRIFVEIPGAGTTEVVDTTIDDLVEKIVNKARRHGGVVHIKEKSSEHAILTVWKDGNLIETIKIKDFS
jgi:hypothetical protein